MIHDKSPRNKITTTVGKLRRLWESLKEAGKCRRPRTKPVPPSVRSLLPKQLIGREMRQPRGNDNSCCRSRSAFSKTFSSRFSSRTPNCWVLLAFPLPKVGQRGQPESISRPHPSSASATSSPAPLPTVLRKTNREQRSCFALKENKRGDSQSCACAAVPEDGVDGTAFLPFKIRCVGRCLHSGTTCLPRGPYSLPPPSPTTYLGD